MKQNNYEKLNSSQINFFKSKKILLLDIVLIKMKKISAQIFLLILEKIKMKY